jgi:hypothetical protein
MSVVRQRTNERRIPGRIPGRGLSALPALPAQS